MPSNSPAFRKIAARNVGHRIEYSKAAGTYRFDDVKASKVIRARLLSCGYVVKSWLARMRNWDPAVVEVLDRDTLEPRGFRSVFERSGKLVVARTPMFLVLKLVAGRRRSRAQRVA